MGLRDILRHGLRFETCRIVQRFEGFRDVSGCRVSGSQLLGRCS